MSLQEKRERFKCQQKSSGYSSFENSSGDDAGMGDTEIRIDKEHSAVLAEISQGNNTTIDTYVGRSETAVDKCIGVGLGVDINDSKLLSGANGSCNCEERAVAPVINSSDTNEGTGTDINNASELINSPKAERGDNAIDNYEFVDNLVPEGFDKEKEHIEIKANCESGDIALPTDTNDSAELLPVKTTTSATVSNNQNTDGLNSDKGVLSKSRGLSLKTASSDNYGLNTVEENVRKRTQSDSSESDDYRVEKTQLKETCAVPSYRPQLCSTPTDTYNLSVSDAFIQSKEHCDGHRSSISSSASSLASNMSDYKIMVSAI